MSANLKFREITSEDHVFWGEIEAAMKISFPCYVKNVLLYVYTMYISLKFYHDFHIAVAVINREISTRIYRISGYQSDTTLQNLNERILVDLERSMRSLPSLLAEYVKAKDIQMPIDEEFQILGCFNDNGTINLMDRFEEFTFRNGDKKLLLSMAEYIRANCENFPEFCNPNIKLPTISTIIGSFYAREANGTNIDNDINAQQGMKLFSSNFFHSNVEMGRIKIEKQEKKYIKMCPENRDVETIVRFEIQASLCKILSRSDRSDGIWWL